MKELNIKLNPGQVNQVLKGLSKLTWEEANPMIIIIQDQVNEQLKPPVDVEKKD